jgi:hypothetical protein
VEADMRELFLLEKPVEAACNVIGVNKKTDQRKTNTSFVHS